MASQLVDMIAATTEEDEAMAVRVLNGLRLDTAAGCEERRRSIALAVLTYLHATGSRQIKCVSCDVTERLPENVARFICRKCKGV